ncbi:hypothetical protein [Okeania sp. SIO1I7]|uniref:hypothetical protein n=1 Tax=Okeania sp. SIO1I7 TaxID=2607772 RepID=UPI0013FBC5C2|nr:hypothetical protein [Okeania sp. SIO1I7]NET27548.1 hypothetical protein [Okeania sp. SIO1I7]
MAIDISEKIIFSHRLTQSIFAWDKSLELYQFDQCLLQIASARRQKAGGRRQKGRKVILQAFEPFLTG